VETKRVLKNADVRHPSSTAVMHRRKSASPVHNVLIFDSVKKINPFSSELNPICWHYLELAIFFTLAG